MIKKISLLFSLPIIITAAFAQSPYVLNGSAKQDDCHCYTLTTEMQTQSGSIWNKNKIDLTKPFNYFFNVFLGCADADGADGIAFVLQPVSTSLGSSGEGLGFQNIIPSVGVTIDTWQNTNQNDPSWDHIAIQANGDVNHTTLNNLAGPVQALADNINIEDCQWHMLEIKWNPATDSMIIKMDGVLRLAMQKDIIATIFYNDPMVYWGFTSATGGSFNLQKMCTSLDAAFKLAPHDNTCIGTPLTFIDSSVSFGNIAGWYWNFGDGTTYTSKNPPSHTYAKPGIYTVTLNITGGDGCTSDTTKQEITVGSYPVADFNFTPSLLCDNRSVTFTDATSLDVGTENYWYWNLGNGATSSLQNPLPIDYAAGKYAAQLYVKTAEGCASDTATKIFTVFKTPVIDFTKEDACKNALVNLTAENLSPALTINQWFWNFGDNNSSNSASAQHAYTDTGTYNVSLAAQAANGCITDTITKPVIIYGTYAYAGKDTTILQSYPYQLQASGGINYSWFPPTGLNNPNIANPVTTLDNDITYILTVSTDVGCATTDTINLRVIKGPEIYVPTAFTPNGDGRNDRFKIIPVGISEILFFNIVNRWGQVIYSAKNSFNGWDGTFNGIPQPAGTYIWMVAGKTTTGAAVKKQGTLVLIR